MVLGYGDCGEHDSRVFCPVTSGSSLTVPPLRSIPRCRNTCPIQWGRPRELHRRRMAEEISLESRLARLLSDLCASQTTGSVIAKEIVPNSGGGRGRNERPDREFNGELVKALLGDLNPDEDEPLILEAVEDGEDPEWIKALLVGGADPKARRRRDGSTALHAAVA